MGVSGHRHAPAPLCPPLTRKLALLPTEYEIGWNSEPVWTFWTRQISYPSCTLKHEPRTSSLYLSPYTDWTLPTYGSGLYTDWNTTSENYWVFETVFASNFMYAIRVREVAIQWNWMDAIPLCDIRKAYTDIYVNTQQFIFLFYMYFKCKQYGIPYCAHIKGPVLL